MKSFFGLTLFLASMTSALAANMNWSQVRTCEEGYALLIGESRQVTPQSKTFQIALSGRALESLSDQIGEQMATPIPVISHSWGKFHSLAAISFYTIRAEEKTDSVISLEVFHSQTGEKIADYQFYRCE